MHSPGLRDRDGQLVQHWYIACLSHELRTRPIRREIYERPCVLFRDPAGRPVCLPDRCLHRAVPLSYGRCQAGTLICPYHGWTYDRQGSVVHVPSAGPGPCPLRLRLAPWPVVEQDGCVWVWAGDGPPTTPLPSWRFPYYGEPGWVQYYMVTDFASEVTHLVENFMDVPHTMFVHHGWFRRRSGRRVPITLDVRNGTALVTYHQPNDTLGYISRLLNPWRHPMVHTDLYVFPNLTRVDYAFGPAYQCIINSQCTPVRSFHSRVYTYICFRVGALTRLLSPLVRFYTRRVIQQDVEIMRQQSEGLQRQPPPACHGTAADVMHRAIERLRDLGQHGDPAVYTYQKHQEQVLWI